MATEKRIIAWKTDAWKSPAMVATYVSAMAAGDGGTLLKNAVETELIARFVIGPSVLDVGVGTGRASLPLARRGYHVTGIDSSQAMLDACREQAGETPITLETGDVARLRHHDGRFDTVLALNTIGHFPHWRTILADWKHAVRPGGRVIFDMYSLDHDLAHAEVRSGGEASANGAPTPDESAYMHRLAADELVAGCTGLGFCVDRIIPYGLLFGSGKNHFLAGSRADGPYWDRLLSAASVDERFFAFALFVERSIVAQLTTACTNRYMVVLDNRPDPDSNAAWVTRNDAYIAALRASVDAATIWRHAPVDATAWRDDLRSHLDYAPNLVFLFRLLSAVRRYARIELSTFADAGHVAALCELLEADRVDEAIMAAIQGFAKANAGALRYNGVSFGNALDYDTMRDVLVHGLGLFL